MAVVININQLIRVLQITPENQNIMLTGKHGIGKSQILKQFFEERDQKVVTLFLGQMSDPGDLIGLPRLNEKTGKTDFMLPYWFPTSPLKKSSKWTNLQIPPESLEFEKW